jgi:hypothetical protein
MTTRLDKINNHSISHTRLINQQIVTTRFKTPKEIVSWMGAMQAQDYLMAKWAAGARLTASTDKDIEEAVSKGEILRTHLLRPTWHFVSPDDIHWMLKLTAPNIKASLKSRHSQLELTSPVLTKCYKIIEKALDGTHLNRSELVRRFQKAKITTDDNRAAHIMLCAELDGLVCSGKAKNKKQTYSLLEERVPKTKPFNKDEALIKLANKYFLSRGPATLQDYKWWSGLPAKDAKHSLEMVKNEFISEQVADKEYWFKENEKELEMNKPSIYLLPAFDEFLISYKDRSASLPLENFDTTISNNGTFRPIIVMNGQVTGIWNRTIQNDKAIIELNLFKTQDKKSIKLLIKECEIFCNFLNLTPKIILQ